MAGLIREIVNKTKELFESLISKAQAIINSIEHWIKRIKSYYVCNWNADI